jgi:antitoxin ParD1/3/4
MANIEKISVSLPQDMMDDVREAVELGSYATTSEVVRDALREWQKKRRPKGLERVTPKSAADLKRMIQEGVDSLKRHGGIAAEQVFAELEARYRTRPKRKKAR